MKVAIETFGCRSNYADTHDLQTMLLENGASPVEFRNAFDGDGADVFVINTCSVTDSADKEAHRLIAKVKERFPHARLVVTGCLAEVGREGVESLAAADSIISPGRKHDVVNAIFGKESEEDLRSGSVTGKKRGKRMLRPRSISLNERISEFITPPTHFSGEVKSRARYHLRVQEGCENDCTFCIIPRARGSLSSRPLDLILEDLRVVAGKGFAEVVLTGTHLGGYGEDIGLSLVDLISAVAENSAGLRVRLSSLDPNDVSERVIETLAATEIFCPHLHLCFQAFTDEILKRMNRRYRLAEAIEVLNYARRMMPGACIGSDVITGFPGESRELFDQGMELFSNLPLDYLHVFPYSERSETAAIRLDGVVPVAERRRRAQRIRAEAERKYVKFAESFVGRPVEMVVETIEDGEFSGTTAEFLTARCIGVPPCNRGEVISVFVRGCDSDGTLSCMLGADKMLDSQGLTLP